MADRTELAEAYNVLGSIVDAAKQADGELQALEPKLLQEEKALKGLLEKVTAQGDETNIARVQTLLDQVQQAWITIQQSLGDQDQEDQPQEENDDDGQDRADSSGVPRSEPGVVPGERGPEPAELG